MKMADLKDRLKAVGSSQVELAKFMKVNLHRVNRIANDKRMRVSQVEVDQIRRFFEMREKPVYEAASDQGILPGNQLRAAGRVDVPVFGGIDTPDGWTLSLANFAQVGRLMPHPAQLSAQRPFAVEVVDETMSPRFEPGEIAYVAGGQMPRRGQDCLVEFADLTARILQFVERTERMLIFRQLNPAQRVTKAASDKIIVHAIVGRGG